MQVDNLILTKCIGKNTFGTIYLTSFKEDNGKKFATQRIERNKVEGTDAMNYLKNNIIILKKLNHPNIIKFETIKKTKNYFYIVLEYCNGGELFDALYYIKKNMYIHFQKKLFNI